MTTQITASSLPKAQYNNLFVITTEILSMLYGADVKNIQNNYLRNEGRFVVGKHYFKLEGDELKEFMNKPSLRGLVANRAKHLILWTERGAARHAKMLETDQAWEVFEKLEDCYFSQKEKVVPARSPERGHPAPTFRYIITLTYKDAVTGQEETFTGGANNPGEIIQGTARRFGIFVSEMINIPVVAY
ncbi:MAG: ORF6N domain-containing protein [Hafnia sp.]